MRILLIKLSAIGDVLRTTTLLRGLKREYSLCEITWLTSADAAELLKENPLINSVIEFDKENIGFLERNSFDLLICLDKEIEVTSLAARINAGRKIGFSSTRDGKLTVFNKESEYGYKLGISDELKFRINKKTYPQIIYEMCGLRYRRDRYILNLTEREIEMAKVKLKNLGINDRDFVVGLNTGAGHRFVNKIWGFEKHKACIEEMLRNKKIKVLLLGGRSEEELNKRLKRFFRDKIYDAGTRNSLREFAAILRRCNIIITGDTLAMHIGIAMDRYVVAVFGPTCSHEIELYGNGRKIISDIRCSPCYKKQCDKKNNCMSKIKISEVIGDIAI